MPEQSIESKTALIESFPGFFYNFTSAHTRNSYASDIFQFLQYLERLGKPQDFSTIDRELVIRFRNFLSEMGGRFGRSAAPKTISRKLAGLSSFFDYLVESKVMTYNPCSSVKRPKRVVVSPTEALRPEQVTELLQTARDNKNSGPLHYALLCTFFTTGLRKSEVLHLLMRDYEVHGEHRLLHYKGKGGKMGRKVLHPMCTEAIDEYIEWMNEKERTLQKEDWLFQPTRNPSNPGELNKPLNPKTINELLDRYAKKCGFAQKVTPHSARATFISTLLDQGIDIYTIAGEVDHSSVVTTQSYDKRDKKLEQSPTLKLKY